MSHKHNSSSDCTVNSSSDCTVNSSSDCAKWQNMILSEIRDGADVYEIHRRLTAAGVEFGSVREPNPRTQAIDLLHATGEAHWVSCTRLGLA